MGQRFAILSRSTDLQGKFREEGSSQKDDMHDDKGSEIVKLNTEKEQDGSYQHRGNA